jgi:hypothetical protein
MRGKLEGQTLVETKGLLDPASGQARDLRHHQTEGVGDLWLLGTGDWTG